MNSTFSYSCEVCGTTLYERNCKALCPNCGRMLDCSDLPVLSATPRERDTTTSPKKPLALDTISIAPEALQQVSYTLARQYNVLPLRYWAQRGALWLAVEDWHSLADVGPHLNAKTIVPIQVDPEEIRTAVRKWYP